MPSLPFDLPAAIESLVAFLERGGPAMWAIFALSVLTLALILWKLADLARLGAWSGGRVGPALALWQEGRAEAAGGLLRGRRGAPARLARAAMATAGRGDLAAAEKREAAALDARGLLAEARSGLRGLELVATIAPLLGLLGTVLGMIAAFQALQEAGARADPAALAGGIWEALLTTAAGMAVAIPASVALTWFESLVERLRRELEAVALAVLHAAPPRRLAAAE